MDFLSAFSGLERIAIIAGAMLIGFWGYRLFATDRTPALIFMGIACAVLFGALFTSGSHIKNIGASYQLATASHADRATPQPAAPVPGAIPALEASVNQPVDQPTNQPAGIATVAPSTNTNLRKTVPELNAAEVVATSDDDNAEPVPSDPAAPATPAAEPTEVQDLLSSQELGGRIVSVKSQTISLEWTPRGR